MKTTLIVLAVLVVVGGGFWLMQSSDDGVEATPSPTASVQASPSATAVVSPSPSPSGTPSRTPTPTTVSKTHTVTIEGFAFSPKTLTVKKGDTIKFTNKDSVAHTATSLTGAFDTGLIAQNQIADLKVSALAAGTYEYKCTPHPTMRGTIIVQ